MEALSSRTFPGQRYRSMSSIASVLKAVTFLSFSRANSLRNELMRSGMSATRSRNGGRWMGTTAIRK